MKIYVVIEDIDDYSECGGGKYPCAVFLNYANATKDAERKQQDANIVDKFNAETHRIPYRVETWETADEKEGC